MADQFEEIRKARRKIIKHTRCQFANAMESYPVHDLSVKGFSFLCEKERCFFDKNLPLHNIVFLDAEGKKIIEAAGTVVYARNFDHNTIKVGASFETSKVVHSILGNIRATRYTPTIQMNATIRNIENGAKDAFQGVVVDYTPSATRLTFPDTQPQGMEPGDSVWLTIASKGDILLDDTAHIIRKKSDNSELIVQFSKKFLDIPHIENITEVTRDQESIRQSLGELHRYNDVSDQFKALVADWRMYLARLKQQLDAENIRNKYRERHDQVFFVKEMESAVTEDMFAYIERLNRISDALDKPQNLLYKQYFREHMEPFLRASPFVASVIDKDRGYAGNFEVIKQFFDDPYQGDTLFAKIINRLALSMDAVTAHQDRINFLYEILVTMYEKCPDAFSFFVLGSGPGEEILRFVEQTRFSAARPVQAALLDMDAFALVDFKDQVQYLDARHFDLTTLNRNLLNIMVGREEDPVQGQFALTYCAGMFDYFSDKACRRIIDYMITHTRPGGVVIVTNVHKNCFSRAFMDYGGEWELMLRDEEDLVAMVPEGFRHEIVQDDQGANIYLQIFMPDET